MSIKEKIHISHHVMDMWQKRTGEVQVTRERIREAWKESERQHDPGRTGVCKFHEETDTVLIGKYDSRQNRWTLTTVLLAEYENLEPFMYNHTCVECGRPFSSKSKEAKSCIKCQT